MITYNIGLIYNAFPKISEHLRSKEDYLVIRRDDPRGSDQIKNFPELSYACWPRKS